MRMSALFTAAIAATSISGELHARDCRNGSSEILLVAEWEADVYEATFGRGINLSVEIKNESEHDLRMVDGRMFFDDVLGRAITNILIHEDANIPSGDTYVQSGRYESFGTTDITRLATAAQSDIVATACITAAVTENGEVLRFDQ